MTWGINRDNWVNLPIRKEECNFHHLIDDMVGSEVPTGNWSIIMACIIRYCNFKQVVELGVWKGGTSALLADAVKDTGGAYVGVDININDAKVRIEKLGLTPYCTFLQGKTHEVAYDGTPIDLLFIDDGHKKEEAQIDWERWSPWVKPGGWIFIDNTVTEKGVMEFLMEIVGTPRFKEEYQYLMCTHNFGMAIIQKRKADDVELLRKRLEGVAL